VKFQIISLPTPRKANRKFRGGGFKGGFKGKYMYDASTGISSECGIKT